MYTILLTDGEFVLYINEWNKMIYESIFSYGTGCGSIWK